MNLPDLSGPRFPQDSFSGRLSHFWNVISPRNFCPSEQKLAGARELIDKYTKEQPGGKAGERAALSDGEVDALWNAKYLLDATYHPDTGELVNPVGRMSSHIPVCTLVCGCMLYFRHTLPALLFWQWANQSVNSLVTYCNRNGTVPLSYQDMATSYSLATGSSWALATGLHFGIPAHWQLTQRLIPFIAGCGPQALNVGFMRQKELREGLALFEDRDLQKKVATKGDQDSGFHTPAQRACLQTWGVRVAIAGPSLGGTALVMNFLEKTRFVKGHAARLTLPLTMGVYGAILCQSVPFGLSIWPQTADIQTSALSASERARLSDETERSLFFNKGL